MKGVGPGPKKSVPIRKESDPKVASALAGSASAGARVLESDIGREFGIVGLSWK